ncbi:hypothetical protein EDB80DRAFT_876864 [Ilyonectria destructans]|nr:hypothetical protein EDB80DRAFT_876864 [Ilyonectria destructans]
MQGFTALLVGLLLPQVTHGERLEGSSPEEEFAVGFDLGQSYGASAVFFNNGTTRNLAKVVGGQPYIDLMGRLLDQQYRPQKSAGIFEETWRSWKRAFGFAPTDDAATLAELICRLKIETEAILKESIARVSITAPLIASWSDRELFDNDLNDAQVFAGLEPWTHDISEPMYLAESRAALVGSKSEVCQLSAGGRMQEFQGQDRGVFFISFTKDSLHTEFTHTGCHHSGGSRERSVSTETKFGLGDLLRQDQQSFSWLELKLHLYFLTSEYLKWVQRIGISPDDLGIILATGEASATLEFRTILYDIANMLPCMARYPDLAHHCTYPSSWEADGLQKRVELIHSAEYSLDPAFAAARGAANWSWLRLEAERSPENREERGHSGEEHWRKDLR